ncbi:MAG: Gfo/Idh/MocA family protein [Bacteroidota bacterium]
MGKTRFAIVGCGVIYPSHAAAILAQPDAELAAVCDIVPERARAAGEKHGVDWYTDYSEMLGRKDLDAIAICTPSGLHGRQAIEAMRAGKHVVVEKPMDITLPAVDEMRRTQKETGRQLAVISQHRWDQGVRTVKRLLDEGRFGRLAMINCYTHWYRSQAYYDSGDWRGTYALDGGGALMNQSIHYIDLLRWLGGPLESLTAYCATLTHRIEVEDTATACVRFASGALGAIQGTTSAYPGLSTRLEVYGSEGSAVIVADRLVHLHLASDPDRKADPDAPASTGAGAADPASIYGEGHKAQYADFLAALQGGGKPLVDGDEGRHAVAIILAIYEAARTGREVRF